MVQVVREGAWGAGGGGYWSYGMDGYKGNEVI